MAGCGRGAGAAVGDEGDGADEEKDSDGYRHAIGEPTTTTTGWFAGVVEEGGGDVRVCCWCGVH